MKRKRRVCAVQRKDIAKKIATKRMVRKMATVMTIFLLLSGCGRKGVEYNVDIDGENGSSDQVYVAGGGSLAESLGAENLWDEMIETEDGKKIQVYAQVEVPDTDSIKILSAKEKQYNAEEVQALCESISEGPVYYHDEGYLTKSELEKQIANVEYEYERFGMDRDLDELNHLKELYENAPEEPVPATDFSPDAHSEYRITYRNMDYILKFVQNENHSYHEDLDHTFCGDYYIKMVPCDYLEIEGTGGTQSGQERYELYVDATTNERIHPEVTEYTNENNVCGLSAEQAERIATDFLSEIGLTDFRVVEYFKAQWIMPYSDYGEDGNDPNPVLRSDKHTNGMILYLYRDVDGMVVDSSNYATVLSSFDSCQSGQIGYGEMNFGETIRICVTKDGVVDFLYDSPMEIGEPLATDVTILDYENILDIMRQSLISYYDDSEKLIYRELKLMYLRYRENDTEEYRLIPVWRLAARKSENYELEQCRVINAIDGTYIDVSDADHGIIDWLPGEYWWTQW